ncbi:unnamed protein product [Rangifer tarandus platyrhynchus]|uniref:Uncharacterized protein n=2 Tax=Rangifer tarandus platyrhynchus TaxID=3082113 RepID=A0ACB0F418_RANTA|nr:unnamed protein product [Rangifer tarandus platyrhynchus]CAI9707700.1 unnamed protein product [Rangifer tarandus platyrhynchus]
MLGRSGGLGCAVSPCAALWPGLASIAGVSRGCPVTAGSAAPCAQTASAAGGPGGPALPPCGRGPATLSAPGSPNIPEMNWAGPSAQGHS